jgi:hypothetical protein
MAPSGIALLGGQLPADQRHRLLQVLVEHPGIESLAARLAMLKMISATKSEIERANITNDEILEAARTDSEAGQSAVADWLSLLPSPEEVLDALRELGRRRPRRVLDALATWSGRKAVGDRSTLVKGLIDQVPGPNRFIRPIASNELDDRALVSELGNEIRQASRAGIRRALANRLNVLAPKTPAGQREVAGILIWLLKSPPKVNFEIAQVPIEALGASHRSGERLARAYEEAADRHDETISKPVAERLEAVGVHLHKKAVSKSAWSRLKAIRKGIRSRI